MVSSGTVLKYGQQWLMIDLTKVHRITTSAKSQFITLESCSLSDVQQPNMFINKVQYIFLLWGQYVAPEVPTIKLLTNMFIMPITFGKHNYQWSLHFGWTLGHINLWRGASLLLSIEKYHTVSSLFNSKVIFYSTMQTQYIMLFLNVAILHNTRSMD